MSKIKNSLVAFSFILALFMCTHVESYGQSTRPPSDVNVVNTPNVTVTNTPSVRDADNPAHQPVQANMACFADNVLGCSETIYTVPSGKRLVIEFVSMEAGLTADQVAQMTMKTTVDGAEVTHRFPLTEPARVFQGEAVVATLAQQVRLYADAGTSVEMKARRNNIGAAFNAIFRFSISGYLVDVP